VNESFDLLAAVLPICKRRIVTEKCVMPKIRGEAEKKLAELRDEAAKKSEYWSKQIEVQRREVNALILERQGKKGEALVAMILPRRNIS
jgi:hypothetical protein